jgi:hypothetical protein
VSVLTGSVTALGAIAGDTLGSGTSALATAVSALLGDGLTSTATTAGLAIGSSAVAAETTVLGAGATAVLSEACAGAALVAVGSATTTEGAVTAAIGSLAGSRSSTGPDFFVVFGRDFVTGRVSIDEPFFTKGVADDSDVWLLAAGFVGNSVAVVAVSDTALAVEAGAISLASRTATTTAGGGSTVGAGLLSTTGTATGSRTGVRTTAGSVAEIAGVAGTEGSGAAARGRLTRLMTPSASCTSTHSSCFSRCRAFFRRSASSTVTFDITFRTAMPRELAR